MKTDDNNNTTHVGENVQAAISIKGRDNRVLIDGADHPTNLRISVSGDNNTIKIGQMVKVSGLRIAVGNHVPAQGASVIIGNGLTMAGPCEFFVYNSLNRLEIGENCLFSRDIIIRCGASPHLIFDAEGGDYLDVSDGVLICDHVWVGERAYITKRATIPSESIVAACAVVTKRFSEPRVALAGNPAKVVRQGVQWFRNHSFLEEGSPYRAAWLEQREKAKRSINAPADLHPVSAAES